MKSMTEINLLPSKKFEFIIESKAYAKTVLNNDRLVSRGFLYKDGKFAFIRLQGEDSFGLRNHLETPGGGVENNETFEAAVKREFKEELGIEVEIVSHLGGLIDYYYPVHQRNIVQYFLVFPKLIGVPLSLTVGEKKLFKGIEYLTIDEAIEAYENFEDYPCNKLVADRELPVLKALKKRLTN